ncbi:unnamed protein product [Adineta steineri]|uniref:Uncharacterized protein n=1 Tax=Adineta steineri TaxID=433720 RepID=A0A815AL21_9BILA|nr:unnamed protein product [Adineta steineri]CAF1306332.1 unnamed protein product [Adineta steineri]CAF1543675.1 unnamed protein product [Adineta steineri]CAF1577874.1 unnamed protein product [Adineta steineri]
MYSYSLLGFILFFIIVIQAKPLPESSSSSSDNSDDNKSAKTNDQLYEIYKKMRVDPRLAMVSNKDLLLYIHKNFAQGNHNMDSNKEKHLHQQQQQQQQQKETN